MKSSKITTLLVIATLPFFTSCASWNTATISVGLKNKDLTYAEAEDALKNGANVKESWAGKCLLEEAAEQNRRDLIELFVEKGGVSCFEADTGKGKPFSLFMYAYEKQDSDLMHFCLKHPDKSKEVMRYQLVDVVGRILYDASSNRYSNILGTINESGVLTCNETEKEKLSREKAWREALINWDSQGIVEGIATGADVNTRIEGHSLLYFAMKNEPRLVLALLDIGAKFLPEEEASLKEEAWKKALADWDETKIMSGIETDADVNMRIDGRSLLYIAVKRDSELVSALKKAGARFTKEEATAILMKIVEEKDDSFAGFTWNGLVLQGADVNAKIGEHSLLYVAKLNNSEYASVLEDAGAKLLPEEVAQLQKKLNEDLKKAIGGGDLEAVERCIKAGADVNDKVVAKDGKMYSPLFLIEIASSGSFGYPVSKIRKLLLDAGASKMSEEEAAMTSGLRLIRALAFVPHQGWNPIAQAVKSGEINLKAEFDGQNAFHMIADLDFSEISFFREKAETIDESFIVALKNAGVNINKKSRVNMTPLAVAIENSNNIAVMVFLRHGANPNDTIPIKGAFGDAGQKTLMSFAIECYNRLVDASRSGQDIDRNVIKRANEIVSLMAEATGTKVTDL